MTATKLLPPHGTTARAKGRPRDRIKGCRCKACRRAENAYNKRRQYAAITGRSYTVDAAPIAKHIGSLIAAGATRHGIAIAARTSTNSVTNIMAGTQPTLRAATARRILAATAADAVDDYHQRLDAVVATRRIRALMAVGHAVANIQSACDPVVVRTTMTQLINGTLPRIRARTDRAVAVAYDRLSKTAGTSALSRNRAARQGWFTPEQWDGEIDNPDADPGQWSRTAKASPTPDEIVADAEWLVNRHGHTWETAAARLGVHRNTLHQYRTRARRAAEAEAAA